MSNINTSAGTIDEQVKHSYSALHCGGEVLLPQARYQHGNATGRVNVGPLQHIDQEGGRVPMGSESLQQFQLLFFGLN
jgi:hypothetical protein